MWVFEFRGNSQESIIPFRIHRSIIPFPNYVGSCMMCFGLNFGGRQTSSTILEMLVSPKYRDPKIAIQIPTYYSPYYGDIQKGTQIFGKHSPIKPSTLSYRVLPLSYSYYKLLQGIPIFFGNHHVRHNGVSCWRSVGIRVHLRDGVLSRGSGCGSPAALNPKNQYRGLNTYDCYESIFLI